MFGTFTQLVGLAAISSTLVSRAAADVVPTAPGPGDIFNEGSACPIQWNLDTTGTWTNFTIQLMTGSNQAMVPLATVVSNLDGTTGTGKLEWDCPEVTPNSAIYFYQFTQAGSPTSWTTRFTIASASGETTEPTETVMVNGKPVGWGTGRLSGASVSLSSDASASSTNGASGGAASGTTTTASSSPSGMTTVLTSPSSSSSSSSTAPSTTSLSSSSTSLSAPSSSSTSQVAAASGSNANSNAAASSSNQTGGASSSASIQIGAVMASILTVVSTVAIFA